MALPGLNPRLLAPTAPPGLQRGPAPRFSILTPAYQAASSIVECVESALAQTTPAHQVIVVDDGSTDGTSEELERYLPRITYVRQENRGTAAALNAGLKVATGEFVSILDADDVYEPERIEALTELAAARPDLDVLMTDAYLEVEGEVVGRFSEHTPFAVDDQQLAILERCFVAWPAVRLRAIAEAGGFDESLRIAHDWECWIRLLHAGCRAGAVDEPLLRYRIAGAASLTDNRVAALLDRVRALEVASGLDLSQEERRHLERSLRDKRREVLLAESEQALRAHNPRARRSSVAIALSRGMPFRLRLKGLAAAIAPRAAARRLAAIEARTGHTRIRRNVPRGTPRA
jgi:Glycosyl transferase family 2